MTPEDSSLAEAPAPMGVASTVQSTGASPLQDAGAGADEVSRSKVALGTQETQSTGAQAAPSKPQEAKGDGQTVSIVASGSSQTMHKTDGGSKHSVAVVSDCGNSNCQETKPRRAAAAAANAVMAEQVKEEAAPLGVVFAKAAASSAPVKKKETETLKHETVVPTNMPSRRPSRAAAAAATAGMARQAKEEGASLGVLISSALVGPFEQMQMEVGHGTKKRTTEGAAGPAAKRSRVAQNTLKIGITEQHSSRGKKRRQASAYEAAAPIEASPIITDIPPLPFTSTSPETRVKDKSKSKSKQNVKAKTKMTHSVKETDDDDARHCEFCKKVANICVLMHCYACRRVYHAQCFVHAFKPYVDVGLPILGQMERLRLEVPERRGNIFRCASCKAAFLDFYESGGYLWDCDCPTCLQPEKNIFYRQRKLVQMMNDMELEKQRKKVQKDQRKNDTSSTIAKPPASTPSRSNSTSRSRRTRGSSATPDEQLVNMQTTRRLTSRTRGVSPGGHELKKEGDTVKAEAMDVVNGRANESKDGLAAVKNETKVEPMDVDDGPASGATKTDDAAQDPSKEPQQQFNDGKPKHSEPHEVVETLKQQTKDEPETQQQVALPVQLRNDSTTPLKQEKQIPKIKYEPVGEPEEPELSGDDLVGTVQVLRDDKNDGWCFPVMCSRTSSLRVSGIMKTGKCKWFPKKKTLVQCNCCDKFYNFSEFVHHTDSGLVKNAKSADEDPMPFLFVEHRDTAQHTLLDDFLPDLRSWAKRQSVNNTPTKSRRSHNAKREALAAAVTPTMTMTNPDTTADVLQTPVSRFQALALFKRPKHKSDKSSTAARLTDPASLNFVAQVVCLSPKYVMNMQNGTLADRVVRSKTPAPGDSFPRKAGWLAFNRKPASARQITCVCCEESFSFDGFVKHAGISLSDLKKKSRHLLYVVERQDESALVPYNTFLTDLDFVTTNGVDLFLDKLHPPPPSPRPI